MVTKLNLVELLIHFVSLGSTTKKLFIHHVSSVSIRFFSGDHCGLKIFLDTHLCHYYAFFIKEIEASVTIIQPWSRQLQAVVSVYHLKEIIISKNNALSFNC